MTSSSSNNCASFKPNRLWRVYSPYQRAPTALGTNGYLRPGSAHQLKRLQREFFPQVNSFGDDQRTADAFRNSKVMVHLFYRSNACGERTFEIVDRQTLALCQPSCGRNLQPNWYSNA
jgi:hypothetical protein